MEHAATFLKSIVVELVDTPDAVTVEHEVDDQGVKLTLTVDPKDMGKVIGGSGNTIDSLRRILRSFGGKHKTSIGLVVTDPEEK